MRFPRVIPTLTVTAACAIGAVPAASAAESTDVAQSSSENWSGYVVGASQATSSETYRSVTGSWIEPTANCSSTSGRTYAAFWVGLGGSGQSGKLEQAGTEADCTAGGTASYHAWYELVPSAPVRVDLAIHAGDHITATTSVSGDEVTNTVRDATTGRSVSRTVRMSDPDVSSAEWIAEAPSACSTGVTNCSTLPLTNFGTARFTGASATDTAGHTGPISDAAWSAAAVTLDPSQGEAGDVGYGGYGGYGYGQATDAGETAGATPSTLSSDGSAFSVAYSGQGAAGTTTSTGGGGYGGGYGYGGGGYGGYGYGGGAYDDGGYGGGSTYGYSNGDGGYTIVSVY